MVESRDLQSSATVPGYRTLPRVCTLVAIKNKAANLEWDSAHEHRSDRTSFDRSVWEAEALLSVCKKDKLDESTPFCPYHSFSTSWWWKGKCSLCSAIYVARIKAVQADICNHSVRVLNEKTCILDKITCDPIPDSVDGHPSHRFAQYPMISAYSVRRDQTQPEVITSSEPNIDNSEAATRDRRRAKACVKFPYCSTRKGNDTDLSSFTGRPLFIKNRSGQEALGRHFTKQSTDRVSWH